MMVHQPQLSLLDKTATLGSWVIAGALFLTVGWFAMEPDDPRGAVSLLARSGSLMMIVQAAALAAVTAAIATVIAGRRLADVGTFAAAIGLAVVSLRGDTTTYLLLEGANRSEAFERTLAIKFAVEALGWFVVVMIATWVSALVMRWCFGSASDSCGAEVPCGTGFPAGLPARHQRPAGKPVPQGKPAPHTGRRRVESAVPHMAGFDVPLWDRLLSDLWDRRLSPSGAGRKACPTYLQQTPAAEGLKHTLIAAVAAFAAMTVLSAGLSIRSIQHGQACFVVAGAVCIAVHIANRMAPVRSALWSILAVILLALLGYGWAVVRSAGTGSPASVPSSHFLRVLPIQYLAVGTAAAIAMFWYDDTPTPETEH